jgi:hypothetical protein
MTGNPTCFVHHWEFRFGVMSRAHQDATSRLAGLLRISLHRPSWATPGLPVTARSIAPNSLFPLEAVPLHPCF